MSLVLLIDAGATYRRTFHLIEVQDDGTEIPLPIGDNQVALYFNNLFSTLEVIRSGEAPTTLLSSLSINPLDAESNPDDNQFVLVLTDEETETILPKEDDNGLPIKKSYWVAFENDGEVDFLWKAKIKVNYL